MLFPLYLLFPLISSSAILLVPPNRRGLTIDQQKVDNQSFAVYSNSFYFIRLDFEPYALHPGPVSEWTFSFYYLPQDTFDENTPAQRRLPPFSLPPPFRNTSHINIQGGQGVHIATSKR